MMMMMMMSMHGVMKELINVNLLLAFDMMTTCRTCSDEVIFVPLHDDGVVVFRVTALSHFLVIYPLFTLIPLLVMFFTYAVLKEMEQG